MTTRQIVIQPPEDPSEDLQPMQISATLVGLDRRPMIGIHIDDGRPISGQETVTVDGAPESLWLVPNTEITPASAYLIVQTSGYTKSAHLVQIDAGGPIGLEDLLDLGTPLPPDDLNRLAAHMMDDSRHISDGDRILMATAGDDLSGHRAVVVADGQAVYADPADGPWITGVTRHAAVAGDPIEVQVDGLMIEAGWSWSPGPVWVGASGQLTQTVPTAGGLILIGRAVAPTKLLVDVQPPIMRAA